jgi:hypothetical protein
MWNIIQAGSGQRPSALEQDFIGSQGTLLNLIFEKKKKRTRKKKKRRKKKRKKNNKKSAMHTCFVS